MKLEEIVLEPIDTFHDSEKHDEVIRILKSVDPADNQDIIVKLFLMDDEGTSHIKYYPYTEENRRAILHIMKVNYDKFEDKTIHSVTFIITENLEIVSR